MRKQFKLLAPTATESQDFEKIYRNLMQTFVKAYATGDPENRDMIVAARDAMHKIDDLAKRCAQQGHGLPFIQIGRVIVSGMASQLASE